jgi:hypothetical protein
VIVSAGFLGGGTKESYMVLRFAELVSSIAIISVGFTAVAVLTC